MPTARGRAPPERHVLNLGWKPAATIDGRAPPGLLDLYDTELRPVGRAVTESTGYSRPCSSHSPWYRGTSTPRRHPAVPLRRPPRHARGQPAGARCVAIRRLRCPGRPESPRSDTLGSTDDKQAATPPPI
ncbi:FAD-dependent monooxygenase [Streptomyces sp. NPDC008313]|uniref:FAD-dependent monooxygenase n=1 Tax=Streptomyces sp. NPDC008313 TaxID=3364826 RepID=UPI0036ED735F